MFRHLTDFSYTRSRLEGIGFYIASLVFGFLLAWVLAVALLMILGIPAEEQSAFSWRFGQILAPFYTGGLALLVAWKKGLYREWFWLLYIPLTIALAVAGGTFISLLIIAYMTTRRTRRRVRAPLAPDAPALESKPAVPISTAGG